MSSQGRSPDNCRTDCSNARGWNSVAAKTIWRSLQLSGPEALLGPKLALASSSPRAPASQQHVAAVKVLPMSPV